jgi:hypothetical protein
MTEELTNGRKAFLISLRLIHRSSFEMTKFYFNDCLPRGESKYVVLSCFEKVLPEYSSIKLKYSRDIDGIVTSKMPEQIVLSEDGFTLKNCIEELTDRNLRKYAFAVFRKYPIEDYFYSENEDDLLNGGYQMMIGNSICDALNLKLVQENGDFVFSLALYEELKRNMLLILDKDGKEYPVSNLFGDMENTAYIEKKIQELIEVNTGNFEKMIKEIGECSYNDQFENSFNKIPPSVQNAIIGCFKAAREREGSTPFYADGWRIKDVTPDKEKDIRVSELRIHNPVGYRVYFYETANCVYLGRVEKKPAARVQDNQIRTSAAVIKQLAPPHL